MPLWLRALGAGVLFLTACTVPGREEAAPQSNDIGFGHVHDLGLNPGDGAIYAATHTGVLRLDVDRARRDTDRIRHTIALTVTGADAFLSSDHTDPPEPEPDRVGLYASTDAARTWRPLSLHTKADFHVLSAAGSTVYGWDSISAHLMRSDDGAVNWQSGARAKLADMDVDPLDPLHVVVATDTGLQESFDGGVTLTIAPVQPPQPLVLLDHVEHMGGDRQPTLAGVDAAGGVWALYSDRWFAVGATPGPAQAFLVLGPDRYVAATAEKVFLSEDAGRVWRLKANVPTR